MISNLCRIRCLHQNLCRKVERSQGSRSGHSHSCRRRACDKSRKGDSAALKAFGKEIRTANPRVQNRRRVQTGGRRSFPQDLPLAWQKQLLPAPQGTTHAGNRSSTSNKQNTTHNTSRIQEFINCTLVSDY